MVHRLPESVMLLNPREILIEKNSLSITQGKIMPTLSESHIRHIHNLDILDFLRAQCAEEMPSALSDETLTALRKKVEAHIKATYLKAVQAPAGVKSVLKAWMELN